MRRKNQGSKIARHCIVWAMTAMLVVGSMAPSQTVFAVDSYSQCDDHTGDGAPDSNAPQYNDDEAAKNAASQTSVQDMQNHVDAAQAAAADAAAAVDTAKKAVDDATAKIGTSEVKDADGNVTTPASGAEGAADTAKTDADAAASAANTAQGTVDSLNGNTANEVKDYNKKAADDQTAADAAAPVTTVNVTDTNGNTTTAQVDDYAKDQAAIAKQKADDAKKAIEAALAVDTTDANNLDVQANVQKARDAASDANDAAEAAQTAVDTAAANLLESIKEYNAYAFAYGLTPYTKEDGTTYTVTDAKGNVVTPGYSAEGMTECGVTAQNPTKDKVQGDIDAIKNADISAQGKTIDAAQASVDAAVAAQAEAQKAADTADKAVKEMNTKLGDGKTAGDVKTAADSADKVNNYYVDPAQTVYDASAADADSKQKDLDAAQLAAQQAADNLTDKNDKLNDATAQSKDEGEIQYGVQLSKLQSAVEEAKKVEIDREDFYTGDVIIWPFGWVIRTYDEIGYNKAVNAAQKEVDDANKAESKFVKKHDSYVSDYVKSDQKVKDARSAADAAAKDKKAADGAAADKQKVFETANAQALSDQAVLTAAKTVRDNYINETTSAYQNNTVDSLESKIDGILSGYSDEINQVEYDKDANHWGNNTSGYDWDLIKDIGVLNAKGDIRDIIDKEYTGNNQDFIDKLKDILNKPAVIQLIIGTKDKDKLMASLTAAYEDELTTYNEEMRTVQVNAAKLSTDDSLKAAQAAATTEKDNLAKIVDINTKVSEAKTDLQGANDKYQAAHKKLDELKVSVKDAKLNSIDLSKLKAAIAAAQKKVDAAKTSLNEAQAAAASAENYKNWAVALVTAQVTNSYGQAAINADGKTVDKNGNVTKNKSEYVTATDNALGYDSTEVTSRPASSFTYNLNTVTVPYSIYKAYVQKMYSISNYSEVTGKKNKMSGKGVMTTDTMPVVYWAVDSDGKLTGKNYLSTDDMPTGAYFVGYTFKHQSDGYHIDGTQVTYTRPAEPTPGPASTNPSTVVTISASATPLAATPAVLGVNRAAAPEVLGANRAADNGQAVLGARRDAKTGDTSNMSGWLALMAAATGAGAAYVLIRRKERKEEQ